MLQGDLCDVTGRLVLCYRETFVMLQGDLCDDKGRIV